MCIRDSNTSLLLEHLVDVYAFISPKPKSSMATHCLHLIQVLSSNIISIFRKTASKKGARDHMLRASIIRLRGELLDTPTIASIAEMISSAHDNGFYSEARTSQLLFVAYHTWANVPVLSLIHISEPTRLLSISYAVFCLKKKIG
eukprot:TRINITY_DN10387_c0_g1_i2.p1 TRINITY_DN10387_c0_g1~~TRINITY_DN10387_c0_g1_i2.p1  ORF type:complete len:145 (+),score=44.64 TRINITY_DN10387_c0_g1_i2:72-506(+)